MEGLVVHEIARCRQVLGFSRDGQSVEYVAGKARVDIRDSALKTGHLLGRRLAGQRKIALGIHEKLIKK